MAQRRYCFGSPELLPERVIRRKLRWNSCDAFLEQISSSWADTVKSMSELGKRKQEPSGGVSIIDAFWNAVIGIVAAWLHPDGVEIFMKIASHAHPFLATHHLLW